MRDTWIRVLLALMAVGSATVGVWAQFFPQSFYDTFPGGGRHWVSADGPYNEHLVRDVGGLNLALTAVTVVACVTLVPLLVRTAAVAALVTAVPHYVYHLNHLSAYDTSDQIGNVVSLGFTVVAPIVVLVLAWPRATSEPRQEALGRTV